jgi:hypothetical protein
MRLAYLIACATTVVLIACTPAPTRDREKLALIAESAITLLEADVDATQSASIPANDWPGSIASLLPHDVRRADDGVYIEMWTFQVESKGYFVPRHPELFVATEGTDPSYRPLGEGVFWYEIKG